MSNNLNQNYLSMSTYYIILVKIAIDGHAKKSPLTLPHHHLYCRPDYVVHNRRYLDFAELACTLYNFTANIFWIYPSYFHPDDKNSNTDAESRGKSALCLPRRWGRTSILCFLDFKTHNHDRLSQSTWPSAGLPIFTSQQRLPTTSTTSQYSACPHSLTPTPF